MKDVDDRAMTVCWPLSRALLQHYDVSIRWVRPSEFQRLTSGERSATCRKQMHRIHRLVTRVLYLQTAEDMACAIFQMHSGSFGLFFVRHTTRACTVLFAHALSDVTIEGMVHDDEFASRVFPHLRRTFGVQPCAV